MSKVRFSSLTNIHTIPSKGSSIHEAICRHMLDNPICHDDEKGLTPDECLLYRTVIHQIAKNKMEHSKNSSWPLDFNLPLFILDAFEKVRRKLI